MSTIHDVSENVDEIFEGDFAPLVLLELFVED
jgi:hypothetical protein